MVKMMRNQSCVGGYGGVIAEKRCIVKGQLSVRISKQQCFGKVIIV